MKQDEYHEQVALIEYAELKAKTDPRWKLLFAIPNGGHRHILTAVKLKRSGVKAGVPDLCLPVVCKGYSGLFLEMKSKKGKVTDNQKMWIDILRKGGYKVFVAEGFEKAKDMLEWYLNGDDSKAKEPLQNYRVCV